MRPPDQLTVLVRMEDDAFWATVEECPGVFASGDTVAELRSSLAEALGLYFSEEGQAPPQFRLGAFNADVAPTQVSLAVV